MNIMSFKGTVLYILCVMLWLVGYHGVIAVVWVGAVYLVEYCK